VLQNDIQMTKSLTLMLFSVTFLLSTEFGHATACWLTGGKVHGIEVYTNEGGVTKYTGGWRFFVIPAGYLGGAFWGAVFVVMSGDRWASLSIAIIFCVGMAVSLFFAPNATMVGLNIGFIVLTVAFILVDQLAITPFLQFLTLFCKFVGSICSMSCLSCVRNSCLFASSLVLFRRCIHWNL